MAAGTGAHEEQMESATEETSGSGQAATTRTADLVIKDRGRIRQAMHAARTIMQRQRQLGTTKTCRLVSLKGSREVTVLACDGDRAAWIEVASSDGDAKRAVDIAMPLDAVRAIAKLTGRGTLEVRAGDGNVGIRAAGDNARWHEYDEPTALSYRSLERIREFQAEGTRVQGILRRKALDAIRRMPAQDSDICRLARDSAGILRVWATPARHVGPGYEAEAVLEPHTAETGPKIVFGLNRKHLTETLRDMASTRVTVTITAADRPLEIIGVERNEQFVVSTKRLN